MLLEKSFGVNDIVCLKTIWGEEVIAKCVELTDTHIHVSKPATFVMMGGDDPRTGGRAGLGFLPFMLGLEENSKVKIEMSKVFSIGRARKDVVASYIQATTGLAVPTEAARPNRPII